MYRHGVGGYPTERPVLMHTWNTFTVHLRQRFGQRVQKIPLDAGASCPNRDGTLSRAGCTFCNAIGSGSGLGLAGMRSSCTLRVSPSAEGTRLPLMVTELRSALVPRLGRTAR